MYKQIARFLTQKSHFSSEKKIVKPTAFMPNKNGETSAFGLDELTNDEIIGLGREYIKTQSGSPPKGRAELLTDKVLKTELKIDFNNVPPRHLNIIGWPEQKHNQKLKAIILASYSTLQLH
ncbi:MAG: hypothetical protein KAW56_05270 [Candidatus Marinimicrobia bacterium]|nr:hypothetical protein [Candidatus Neomarinimicrobiota bacterium]